MAEKTVWRPNELNDVANFTGQGDYSLSLT